MKIRKTAAILMYLCLAGCMVHQARPDLSAQVQVFGVELYSGVDYREIKGVTSSEEPCLKGYERSFDSLDITIGYGFNRKIRKITTRNRQNSLFGISPGINAEQAGNLARKAGLKEVSPVRFSRDDLNLLLLVDDRGNVFGITIELND